LGTLPDILLPLGLEEGLGVRAFGDATHMVLLTCLLLTRALHILKEVEASTSSSVNVDHRTLKAYKQHDRTSHNPIPGRKTSRQLAASSEDDSSSDISTWTYEEELKARWKVDTSVLPLLFLGLLVFQLDRMNLASALTGGFRQDIRINQSTVNLGNQMMFLGMVVLEIPFNLILQRLGPRKWISAQVFVFGLIATLQVLVKNRNGFLVVRSFLGIAEAGYIPGSIYTLSTWYKKEELAKRVAIFFFGMFGGNALSPILASGILHLDGHRGLSGWQWIFLLEGVFTMSVAILLLFVLPGSPDQPKPLLSPGLVRLSARDQEVLQERLARDDKEKKGGAQGLVIPWKLVRETLLHYKRWPSLFSTFCVFTTWSPLTTYTPTIYV
jgi:MFS family permease